MAKKNDFVIFEEKKKKKYQIIGKTKKPFDERIIIKEILNGKI